MVHGTNDVGVRAEDALERASLNAFVEVVAVPDRNLAAANAVSRSVPTHGLLVAVLLGANFCRVKTFLAHGRLPYRFSEAGTTPHSRAITSLLLTSEARSSPG